MLYWNRCLISVEKLRAWVYSAPSRSELRSKRKRLMLAYAGGMSFSRMNAMLKRNTYFRGH